MADSKLTELTELTSFSGDEQVYVVDDDDGTPASRRMTVENLAAGLAARTELTGAFATVDANGRALASAVPALGDEQSRPLLDLTLLQIEQFLRWCRINSADGFVGEIGWPYPDDAEGPRWNDLGDVLYAYMDRKQVPMLHWAARKFTSSDVVRVYESTGGAGGTLATSRGQAKVLRRHPTVGTVYRGISVADGSRGFSESDAVGTGSNLNPGTYGTDYIYPSAGDYTFLAAEGIDTVRLVFRWERVQPTLNAALDTTEVTRLQSSITDAVAAGISVVLVPKNAGSYYLDVAGVATRKDIGSGDLPISAFVDFWDRMSETFKANAGVLAYDLMNEPSTITKATWHDASQQAVTAIRANTDTKLILVEGASFSTLGTWLVDNGATGWITDSAANFAYSPHLYPGRIAYDRELDSYGDEARTTLRLLERAQFENYTSLSEIRTMPTPVSSAAITSGRLYIMYLVAPIDLTISQLSAWVGGTASASLTLARMSVGTVNTSHDITIVAETASDTTLFNGTFAEHARSLDATRAGPTSYRLAAGTRYAALLLVTGTTMPALVKTSYVAGAMGAQRPEAFQLAGQTDIVAPGSTILRSSLSNPADRIFIALKGTADTVTY